MRRCAITAHQCSGMLLIALQSCHDYATIFVSHSFYWGVCGFESRPLRHLWGLNERFGGPNDPFLLLIALGNATITPRFENCFAALVRRGAAKKSASRRIDSYVSLGGSPRLHERIEAMASGERCVIRPIPDLARGLLGILAPSPISVRRSAQNRSHRLPGGTSFFSNPFEEISL